MIIREPSDLRSCELFFLPINPACTTTSTSTSTSTSTTSTTTSTTSTTTSTSTTTTTTSTTTTSTTTTSTTTSTTTTLYVPMSECDVFLVEPNGDVYGYNPSENSCWFEFSAGREGVGAVDIANTDTKLWICNSSILREFDISLNPFSYSFNREIYLPISVGAGLGVKSANDYTQTYELLAGDITIKKLTLTPGGVTLLTMFTLGATRMVTGDVIYNAITDRYLVSNTYYGSAPNRYYITEYTNLGLKTFEIEISYNNVYGLFVYEGENYAVRSTKEVYKITPGGLVYVSTIPTINTINGSSQNVSCIVGTTTTNLPN